MLRFIAQNRTRIPAPDENGQYTQADIDQINAHEPPFKLSLNRPGTVDFFINSLTMYDDAQQNNNNNSPGNN